jgi:hypothetical protein
MLAGMGCGQPIVWELLPGGEELVARTGFGILRERKRGGRGLLHDWEMNGKGAAAVV